ncbi:MAG: hypothetical protein KI793_01935 [Rivularia sp. (in: Bacteria)]|nr:hypothetical protein [Rivularia sp. MS3]
MSILSAIIIISSFDIDLDSPNRGELLPTVASTFRPDINYVPPFLLGVGIFAQLDEVKEQYSEFFDSFQKTGVAVVTES